MNEPDRTKVAALAAAVDVLPRLAMGTFDLAEWGCFRAAADSFRAGAGGVVWS